MVVQAKPDVVSPEFLPFLMMSDRFMSRAVEISVGSLSPTINWTTLKLEEFDLPPLDQQNRIAEIFRAVDDSIAQLQTSAFAAMTLRNAKVKEAAKCEVGIIALGDIAFTITSGSRGWAEHYSSDGAVFVRITNLQRGNVRLDWSNTQHVSPPKDKEAERTKVQIGDILISITAELGLVAVAEDMPGEAYVNQHIAKVCLDQNKYDPYLAAIFLSLSSYSEQFGKFNDKGAKAGMNLKNVAKLSLPALARSDQKNAVAEIKAIESSIAVLKTVEEKIIAFRTSLLRSLTDANGLGS